MTHPDRWWSPDRHAARRPGLLARNRIKAGLRAFLAEAGFTEIEAAALQTSPGNETHLHAFATEALTLDGRRAPLYLHTSPEFAAKKLLAAGEERIFDFARVFRNRERTALHAPEFTMLEWYRTGPAYDAVMDDAVALVRLAAGIAGATTLRFRGATVDPAAAPERLPVPDAFARLAGVDLLATLLPGGEPDRPALAAAVAAAGIRTAPDDTWSDLFSRVMAERVEPAIGRGRMTLLTDYPAPEAALARRHPSDPRLSQRFELFACGVELANGFGELTDPVEQRARFLADMDEKERLYGERYPVDEDLLAALPAMPEAAGVAMGFDRLVMLCLGADRIDDVQWTPVVDPFAEA
ncbi:MAG: EF-P lysine aminoacylase GenX [Bauldia sp.]|nr:EF-P lysine aminoacylase GenX [Bauldia sp.]